MLLCINGCRTETVSALFPIYSISAIMPQISYLGIWFRVYFCGLVLVHCVVSENPLLFGVFAPDM